MEQVILVRFSEIHLKGKNKGYFLKLLYTNIKTALKDFNKTVMPIQNRVVISDYNLDDEQAIIDEVKKYNGSYPDFFESVLDNYENVNEYAKTLKRKIN